MSGKHWPDRVPAMSTEALAGSFMILDAARREGNETLGTDQNAVFEAGQVNGHLKLEGLDRTMVSAFETIAVRFLKALAAAEKAAQAYALYRPPMDFEAPGGPIDVEDSFENRLEKKQKLTEQQLSSEREILEAAFSEVRDRFEDRLKAGDHLDAIGEAPDQRTPLMLHAARSIVFDAGFKNLIAGTLPTLEDKSQSLE